MRTSAFCCARIPSFAAASALLASAGLVHAGSLSFTPLGFADSAVGFSLAQGISSDGSVVVGFSNYLNDMGELHTAGFRWTSATGLVALPADSSTGTNDTSATCVSDDGEFVGGTIGFTNVFDGFYEPRNGHVWTNAGTSPVAAFVPGGTDSEGRDFDSYLVNDCTPSGGRIVGATRDNIPFPEARQAFYRDGSGATTEIGTLPGGSYSIANGVSSDGSVIVGVADNADHAAPFRWTQADGMTELTGNTAGLSGQANGVSADGSTIVGTLGSNAFAWTSATEFIDLGQLPAGGFAQAQDVSGDGSVIVGNQITDDGVLAWIYTDGAMIELNTYLASVGVDTGGYFLLTANAISDDGLTICGAAISPNFEFEAYVVHIPSPASVLVLGGLLPLAARRRR